MGGKVSVDSEVGKGTTFTIEVTLKCMITQDLDLDSQGNSDQNILISSQQVLLKAKHS